MGALAGAGAVGADAVAATGCGGSSSSSSSTARELGRSVDKTPVTLTLWHMFAGEESKPFNDALDGLQDEVPVDHDQAAGPAQPGHRHLRPAT